ncbi:hypothetical protein [Curvibacter gracilis]|nr:hypothetical protein [Curvibacter gracilis]
MKFIIHFAANALTRLWQFAIDDQSKADEHHDPVAAAPRGPLLSILTNTN